MSDMKVEARTAAPGNIGGGIDNGPRFDATSLAGHMAVPPEGAKKTAGLQNLAPPAGTMSTQNRKLSIVSIGGKAASGVGQVRGRSEVQASSSASSSRTPSVASSSRDLSPTRLSEKEAARNLGDLRKAHDNMVDELASAHGGDKSKVTDEDVVNFHLKTYLASITLKKDMKDVTKEDRAKIGEKDIKTYIKADEDRSASRAIEAEVVQHFTTAEQQVTAKGKFKEGERDEAVIRAVGNGSASANFSEMLNIGKPKSPGQTPHLEANDIATVLSMVKTDAGAGGLSENAIHKFFNSQRNMMPFFDEEEDKRHAALS